MYSVCLLLPTHSWLLFIINQVGKARRKFFVGKSSSPRNENVVVRVTKEVCQAGHVNVGVAKKPSWKVSHVVVGAKNRSEVGVKERLGPWLGHISIGQKGSDFGWIGSLTTAQVIFQERFNSLKARDCDPKLAWVECVDFLLQGSIQPVAVSQSECQMEGGKRQVELSEMVLIWMDHRRVFCRQWSSLRMCRHNSSIRGGRRSKREKEKLYQRQWIAIKADRYR